MVTLYTDTILKLFRLVSKDFIQTPIFMKKKIETAVCFVLVGISARFVKIVSKYIPVSLT